MIDNLTDNLTDNLKYIVCKYTPEITLLNLPRRIAKITAPELKGMSLEFRLQAKEDPIEKK